MASIEEGSICKNDEDCPAKQYCYSVSGRCVAYTLCKRYNRLEMQNHARHPSQCGPCISGHSAEVLGTGEEVPFCKKMHVQDVNFEHPKMENAILIWIIVGIFSLFMVLCALVMWIRKRSCGRRKEINKMCVYRPTAPPLEHSPFIAFERKKSVSPYNNNRRLMDKNTLVSTTPFKDPSWIKSNPNYGHHLSDESLDSVESGHSSQMAHEEEDGPERQGRVANGELAIEIPARQEIAAEQTDNAVVVHGNFTLPSSGAETTNEEENSSNRDNTNDNSRNRSANLTINQKITMNVNVLNGNF